MAWIKKKTGRILHACKPARLKKNGLNQSCEYLHFPSLLTVGNAHLGIFKPASWPDVQSEQNMGHLHWHRKILTFHVFFFWGGGRGVARQLPLNYAKIPNKKTHLWNEFKINFSSFSLLFSPNVNARSPLAGFIQFFWLRGMWPSWCTVVKSSEKLRLRTTYPKNMRMFFFCTCTFLAITPQSYGFFSASVNGTSKNQSFPFIQTA